MKKRGTWSRTTYNRASGVQEENCLHKQTAKTRKNSSAQIHLPQLGRVSKVLKEDMSLKKTTSQSQETKL